MSSSLTMVCILCAPRLTLSPCRADFVVYEMVKKSLTPAGQDPAALSLSAVMIAGGSAGVAMWTLAIPPDVRPSARSTRAGWTALTSPTSPARRSSSRACRVRPRARTRASWTARARRSPRTASVRSSRASGLPWRGCVSPSSTPSPARARRSHSCRSAVHSLPSLLIHLPVVQAFPANAATFVRLPLLLSMGRPPPRSYADGFPPPQLGVELSMQLMNKFF